MAIRPRSLRPPALAGALGVLLQLTLPGVAHAATGSTLTLNATPSTAKVGDEITLSGMLSFDDASSAAGLTISLTRDDGSGPQPLPDVVTDSGGAYSTSDTVDAAGSVTYEASFAGDGTHDPANANDTVSVTKYASTISLAVSAKAVTYGTSVHLTAHLGRGTESKVVTIAAKPDGGSETAIRTGTVDSHRELHASYTPSKDTTFIARYDGDPAHRASHDEAVTRVRVIVKATLSNFVVTSGKYHIYKKGARAPCIARVIPNHKGFDVRATLQMFVNHRWRKSAARSFRLNSSSVAGFAIRGTSNVNFRVHVSLPTHRDHLGDTSPWQYLRFR
jgi:hypothetical protein